MDLISGSNGFFAGSYNSMIVRNFGQGWFKDGEGVYQGSYEYNGNLMFR